MIDLSSLENAVKDHRLVARVVVAAIEGSAPREPGAAMLVWADGQSGTIGGGALEFEAAAEARRALSTGRSIAARMPLGPALGQCCGGAVVLVTEVFDAAALSALPGTAYLRRIEGTQDAPLALRRAASEARSSGAAVETAWANGWMLESLAIAKRPLWIFGAGHVGRALINVLAPLPGVSITWVDTAADRFPETLPKDVTQLVAARPADVVAYAPCEAEHLVLTYSHALDLEICHALLRYGFARAGLIGSATKWARFRKRLRALGHSEAAIDRINCPIGDPGLGKHPQAIAVGVAAELLNTNGAVASQEDVA
ncbi:MAG: xanthine dehydrogenase accessory protein XdhC [Rhodobacter sp.]|nr:xanthine dehydrogenase accessory protein XdhC [Rhodobacter sp.]